MGLTLRCMAWKKIGKVQSPIIGRENTTYIYHKVDKKEIKYVHVKKKYLYLIQKYVYTDIYEQCNTQIKAFHLDYIKTNNL